VKKRALRERLLSKAVINWETGCWEWTACRNSTGYGVIGVDSHRNRKAHRVSYELMVGPIPAGLQLDHLCRVRHCINPAHLEPVTSRENTMRSPISIAAINAAKTYCSSGRHEYTPENTINRKGGKRSCRECNREVQKRWYASHRDDYLAKRRIARSSQKTEEA
jgi:hypothetical protein